VRSFISVAGVVALSACASSGGTTPETPAPVAADTTMDSREAFASTYQRKPFQPVVIQNATILTATGSEIPGASIAFENGLITGIGSDVTVPSGAMVVDGTGKYVTPGIIDTHSHIGVYAAPGTRAESDGNEATDPVTAQVWAEHSVWPQDPKIPLAIAGGITVIQALPGSANLIGGRSVTLRMVPSRTVQGMKYPGAPYGMKMACGENPKRVYQSRGPSTRMGNMAGYRQAFIEAAAYQQRWDTWEADSSGNPPTRNLKWETIAGVLEGDIYVHNHCYRADEMAQMMDLGREFGFTIRSFHHGVEAYKIADLLAAEGTAASVWADWWGFKMEAYDGIPENAGLLEQAGATAIIHSDDASGIQRLNQEAAKAMYAAQRAGIEVTREQAIKWITANPAWALGIDSTTGTLEVGKHADVVLWSGDPFSVYSKAEQVYNDGWLVFDRNDPDRQMETDFNLGQGAPGVGR